MSGESSNAERSVGRSARSPLAIPWAGWLDVLSRVVDRIGKDRAALVAAGVAYYATLALFPALLATFSLYALWADPSTLARQMSPLGVAMPDAARALIESEVRDITASPRTVSFGVVASVAFSFFAASSSMVALIEGVNTAYEEQETRGFLVLRWLALRLAVGISLTVCIAMTSFMLVPALSKHFALAPDVRRTIAMLRWPALGLIVMAGLALLYRYAPNRTAPKLVWVLCGAALATAIWLGASLGLSAYVDNFETFNRTYGATGAVVVLLLWFYVSGFAILLGAELNAELEHQTAVDTTVGPEAPMGQRHAVKADTLGESLPTRPLATVLRSILERITTPRRGKAK